jgi:hypothetical protein
MTRFGFASLISCLLSVCALQAQEQAGPLPIRRVVLYKNGVGYFEHLGRVKDNQTVPISFTSGQLNDVLKSLTVLDLGGGRITGVQYDSTDPIEKQLGDLRLPSGQGTRLTEFLGGLRGARLEVRSGANVVTGRLLSIERKTRVTSGTAQEVDSLALMADGGEVRTMELSPPFSVRLLEAGLAGKVDRLLDIVSAGRDTDMRRMAVSTSGTGERSLFVSYISEVPIWKATYRIVLGARGGQGPLLQGWAIVDNTVGQDWENVQLSLVAGAPQSFIQNLSQPYYSRRPVIPLPQAAITAPQTYQPTLVTGGRLTGTVTDEAGAVVPGARVRAYNTAGGLIGNAVADGRGVYELQGMPVGTVRLEVEKPGFRRATLMASVPSTQGSSQRDVRLEVGTVTESITVTAPAETPLSATGAFRASGRGVGGGIGAGSGGGVGPGLAAGVVGGVVSSVPAAMARAEAAASAQELGDLFEYRLKEPITIQKNRSALVPILQSAIKAEKVSIWNDQSGLRRPLRALWLENSTGLTLDGGSFSVMEEEAFAGEGVFEPISAGEKRLLSYATDLALNASSRGDAEPQRVLRVRVSKGVMTQESEIRESRTYTFRNQDSSPRTVIVEHPVRAGYELRGETRPVESTASWTRFRLEVPPKQTAILTVEEARPSQATYQVAEISSDQLGVYVREKSIPKEVEDALRRIVAQQAVIGDLESQKSARQEETEKIYGDQQRLRENLKALKGSAEEKALVQRYTRQLDEQENRLETLRKETKQIDAQGESAQQVFDKMVQELSFDVKL